MRFETRFVELEVEGVLAQLSAVCIQLTAHRTPGAYWNWKAQSMLP